MKQTEHPLVANLIITHLTNKSFLMTKRGNIIIEWGIDELCPEERNHMESIKHEEI